MNSGTMLRPQLQRALAACLFACAWILLSPAPEANAACSVGTTLAVGSCPGLAAEGCCATPTVVQWCEGGDWCQLDCTLNQGGEQSCVYDPTSSCCQRCDDYDDAAFCQCDTMCEIYGDCCTDFADVCLAAEATSCGWRSSPTFSGYDCTQLPQAEPTGTFPYTCDTGGGPGCSCLGKQCGDDGCGNSCGDCPVGYGCDGTGLCQCLGSCLGKQCGDDGCGNSCGTCVGADFCVNGLCQSSCEIDCAGKNCGDDGCGGSCGTCLMGETCDATGVCVSTCQPSCTGKQCGDDGCGGQCGVCPDNSSCVEATGLCAPDSCVADCVAKQCGSDGCGGTCGSCGAGELCDGFGQCQQACTSDCAGKQCGNDGCGGSCGTCPSGSCQDHLCVAGCIGACTGKACGDDGCGGSCGGCAPGEICSALGQCDEGCAPDCAGKQCGNDGCGGSCGTCSGATYCGPLGTCVASGSPEITPPSGPPTPCPEGTYWNALVEQCTADDGSQVPENQEAEVASGCSATETATPFWLMFLALLLWVRRRPQTIP